MTRFAVLAVVLAAPGAIGQEIPAPYGIIVQLGVAGVLGVLLLRRYDAQLDRERADREHVEEKLNAQLNREREDRERIEERLNRLIDKTVSEMVPLVSEVQRTMVPSLDRLATEWERIAPLLERLVTDLQHLSTLLDGRNRQL